MKTETTEPTVSQELTLRFDTDVVPAQEILARELFGGEMANTFLAEVGIRCHKKAKDAAPDLTTKKGRDELASIAYIPRRIRSAIATAKKEHTADLRAMLDHVNQAANVLDRGLDTLAKDLRAPLDAMEAEEAAEAERKRQAEEERVARIDACLNELHRNLEHDTDATSDQLRSRIQNALTWQLQESIYQDSLPEANKILAEGLAALRRDLELVELREKDKAREAEERRVAKLRQRISDLRQWVPEPGSSLDEWSGALDGFTRMTEALADFDWQEFAEEAADAIRATESRIRDGLAHARKIAQPPVAAAPTIHTEAPPAAPVVEGDEPNQPDTAPLPPVSLAHKHAEAWLEKQMLPARLRESLAEAMLAFAAGAVHQYL